MAAPKKRKSKSRRCERHGILNRYGDLWTPSPFETEKEARQYLEAYWRNFPGGPHSTRHFKIVPVRVTVTPIEKRR
jgi:hypothetical protein